MVTMAMGKLKDVNTFIEVFPKELMSLGNSKQIAWNPNSITNDVKAPRPLPHGDYMTTY